MANGNDFWRHEKALNERVGRERALDLAKQEVVSLRRRLEAAEAENRALRVTHEVMARAMARGLGREKLRG
jgi:hypothetical protein